MALNKLKFNSINVTPAANEALKFNSSANGFETGSAGGAMTVVTKVTASSSSTIDFTSGIDSTYKEYIFLFNNIHSSANAYFTVNFRDGSSAFDATKTTTIFYQMHKEDDGTDQTQYIAGSDLAQSTSAQRLTTGELSTDNDGCLSGYLYLFDPSSTTFVKHFIAQTQYMNNSPASENPLIAGYCNVTAAIDGVQFAMTTGNIDSGTITLYGIS